MSRSSAVATALTVYGIETQINDLNLKPGYTVATALTVYGIETSSDTEYKPISALCCNSTYRLRY